MSSPIHHAKDLDAKLKYAPPWARESKRAAPVKPATLLADAPDRRIAPMPAGRNAFSGDRAMQELQRRLALHPDRMPAPPTESGRILSPIALRLCAVTGVAALVAWGLVSLTGFSKVADNTARLELPSQNAATDPPQDGVAAVQETQSAPAPADNSSAQGAANPVKLIRVLSATAVPPLQPGEFSNGNAAPPPQPGSIPAPQPSANPSVNDSVAIADPEVAMLLRRGRDYLVNGDIASARLLLRRAAGADSAEAALLLGASFDPVMLARIGAVGATPDVSRAREWYQKAADLGSQTASQQLAKLAQQQ